jgi:hypothetical protein
MYFYPRTLSSSWYVATLANHITSSIRGMGNWYAYSFESDELRDAYKQQVEECFTLCAAAGNNTDQMVDVLWKKKEELDSVEVKTDIFHPWRSNPIDAKKIAVDQCIELVQGARARHYW